MIGRLFKFHGGIKPDAHNGALLTDAKQMSNRTTNVT